EEPVSRKDQDGQGNGSRPRKIRSRPAPAWRLALWAMAGSRACASPRRGSLLLSHPEPAPPRHARDAARHRRHSMTDPRALIIEDEPDLVLLFAHALETAGYQTEHAERGDVALQRLAEVVPHIVILDLYLPGISGVTILHHIHADERLADTHVIIISADALL